MFALAHANPEPARGAIHSRRGPVARDVLSAKAHGRPRGLTVQLRALPVSQSGSQSHALSREQPQPNPQPLPQPKKQPSPGNATGMMTRRLHLAEQGCLKLPSALLSPAIAAAGLGGALRAAAATEQQEGSSTPVDAAALLVDGDADVPEQQRVLVLGTEQGQSQQQAQQQQSADYTESPSISAVRAPEAAAAGGGGSTPAFCATDTLSGLLQQFVLRGESFDSGMQMDGLLAYYRRLGCTPQQIQDAVLRASPGATPPAAGAAGGAPVSARSGRAVSAVVEVDVGGDGGGGPGLWLQRGGLAQQLQVAAWELLAASVAAAALVAYRSRPRGWSRQDMLEVRASSIAGRGVFARAPIPAGTVLGAYPGRLRSGAEMLAKCEYAPLAASYAFRTADGLFLDPTDSSGQPSPYPQPGWPWPLATDVALSYVNEPPKASPGTNATVEDGSDSGELLFVASVDIPAGAEVLIDYGVTYDRTSYGRGR